MRIDEVMRSRMVVEQRDTGTCGSPRAGVRYHCIALEKAFIVSLYRDCKSGSEAYQKLLNVAV